MNLIQLPLNLLGSAPAFWTRLDAAHLWPVVGICVGGLSSHCCLTNAYRHGEAIMVVPLDFLRMPLIAVVAWLLYGEALDPFVFLGSAIIIVGIILNLRAEARRCMEWSPQQEAALRRVAAWLKAGTPQLFRLFGYAGTGKTTLARHIAEAVEGEVAFGAYHRQGGARCCARRAATDASTIHSMIYRSRESDEGGPQFVHQPLEPGLARPTSSSSTNARWSTRSSGATSSPSASRCSCSAIRRSCRR